MFSVAMLGMDMAVYKEGEGVQKMRTGGSGRLHERITEGMVGWRLELQL